MRSKGAGGGLIDPNRRRAGRFGLPLVGAATLSLAGLVGCDNSVEAPRPSVDPIVRDSIRGLQEGDRVHVLALRFGSAGEVVEPDSLLVEAGDWVDFRLSDGSPRLITFALDSMAAGNRDFLQEAGAGRSPPLVAEGSHWVVSFQEAPPGAYPFTVEGPRAPARGVIYVAHPG